MNGLAKLLAITLLACACSTVPSQAEGLNGALEKIRRTGTITLGYREHVFPFSYVDEQKKVAGYSNDIALKISEAIRQHLQLKSLAIKQIPTTVQNRFPMIQDGIIDMECTTTTHNTVRGPRAEFSTTFFIIGTRLMTRRDSGIHDFSDLAGKTVVVGEKTTSDELLRKLNSKMGNRIIIKAAIDRVAPPLTILQDGQADAYMRDDAILYGEIANSWRPEDWIVTGTPQSLEAYACLMHKGDLAFKKVVDAAITDMMHTGEVSRLYQKWFQSPLPPNGLNLRFPMSGAMKTLLRTPNDKALD